MPDDIQNHLEYFRAFLASGRAPRFAMQPSDIHGFLTGLSIAGPRPEEEWLPLIWSGEEPGFQSAEEAWNVTCDLLDFEEQVRCSLGSYRILAPPMLPYVGDGYLFAADWAEGFLQAIMLNPAPWRRAIDTAGTSLATVLAACYDNHDDTQGGLISLEGLDELNYHLRYLVRVMQAEPGHWGLAARAA